MIVHVIWYKRNSENCSTYFLYNCAVAIVQFSTIWWKRTKKKVPIHGKHQNTYRMLWSCRVTNFGPVLKYFAKENDGWLSFLKIELFFGIYPIFRQTQQSFHFISHVSPLDSWLVYPHVFFDITKFLYPKSTNLMCDMILNHWMLENPEPFFFRQTNFWFVATSQIPPAETTLWLMVRPPSKILHGPRPIISRRYTT